MGIPVVIAENGQGFPVKPVEDNAPVMTVAENGLGAPIVISELGAPFVVGGMVPGWVPAGALFAIETTPGGRSYQCDGPVNVNATGGYALNTSGEWVSFAANQPRMTDRGLLVEPAETNYALRAGDPQNMTISTGTGLSAAVVGTGTEGGLPYADWRASGTVTNVGRVDFNSIVFNMGPAAAQGETWRSGLYIRRIAGTIPSTALLSLDERSSGNGLLVSHQVPINLTSFGELGQTVTLTQATTAKVSQAAQFSIPADLIGQAVDFTVRIGAGKVSRMSAVYSPVLTAGAPATRAADTVTLPGISAGTYDLHLRYVSGADRVVTGWSANDPLPFDNRQIVLAWGEAA